jgi:hypothetical protein
MKLLTYYSFLKSYEKLWCVSLIHYQNDELIDKTQMIEIV